MGQQCGFFSPFGEPNAELLSLVKEANENASIWHGGASKNKPPLTETSEPTPPARTSEPTTPAEMFAALNVTAEQQKKLDVLKKERQAAEAQFRNLEGQLLQDTRKKFYAERKQKLQKIFTEEQWAIWSSFWSRPRPATKP